MVLEHIPSFKWSYELLPGRKLCGSYGSTLVLYDVLRKKNASGKVPLISYLDEVRTVGQIQSVAITCTAALKFQAAHFFKYICIAIIGLQFDK